jgi:hypothetical protein
MAYPMPSYLLNLLDFNLPYYAVGLDGLYSGWPTDAQSVEDQIIDAAARSARSSQGAGRLRQVGSSAFTTRISCGPLTRGGTASIPRADGGCF